MEVIPTPRVCLGLSLPKSEHSISQNEDAYAFDTNTGRYALADGATESYNAGLWAKLLVHNYVYLPTEENWIITSQRIWLEQTESENLPWYAETKREEGAFATFLGIEFQKDYWQAVACGDTCLIKLRDGKVVDSLPLQSSEQFNSRPALMGVRQQLMDLYFSQGTWAKDDWFLLLTDALAQWFFQIQEQGEFAFALLPILEPEADRERLFHELIRSLREKKQIRDDDSTLVAIQM